MKNIITLLFTFTFPFVTSIYSVESTKEINSNHFQIIPNETNNFINPHQIAQGPNKKIYIFDRNTGYISVFSSELNGKFLFNFGGKGEGPGEFKRCDGAHFNFSFDNKNLYFTEFFGGHRWITEMTLDGELVKTHSLSNKTTNYGILKTAPIEKNRYLIQNFLFPKAENKGKDYYYHRMPQKLSIIDGKGTVLTNIIETNNVSRISKVRAGGDIGIPFTPNFNWFYNDEDKYVYYSDGQENLITVYDLKGDMIRKIELPFIKKKKVTKNEFEKWKSERIEYLKSVNPEWYSNYGSVLKKYKKSIYKYKPCIDKIILTPSKKYILIAGEYDDLIKSEQYWVVDIADGKLLNTFELRGGGLVIFNNLIKCSTYDEEIGSIVHFYKRDGSKKDELEDLKEFVTILNSLDK